MKARKGKKKTAAKSATAASRKSQEPNARPAMEEIRLRAYEIYMRRGQSEGQDLNDWFQAENELIEEIRKRR